MKAQLCRAFGPVADLEFGEVPDPVPGPGEVLFAVRRASVNFADSLIVGGRYQARPPLPFVPGSEAAGVVLAVGEDVTDFRTGDRVFGFYDQFGAFAEKMCMPAGNLEHLPDFMDFEQGAGLLAATATAHHALRQRGRLAAGETLVVLGAAGGTGTAAVQIGKAIGARVIAVCSSEEKLA
ncbi:MAG: alcohol dehydrogenase catalytic domain-containing protein, partial [Gammaproteobacteria bacterium]